jgi:hypothetical protein
LVRAGRGGAGWVLGHECVCDSRNY